MLLHYEKRMFSSVCFRAYFESTNYGCKTGTIVSALFCYGIRFRTNSLNMFFLCKSTVAADTFSVDFFSRQRSMVFASPTVVNPRAAPSRHGGSRAIGH